MIVYSIFLILLIAIIVYSAATGAASYKILVSATNTLVRQKIYRSWIRESWVLFGIPSLVGVLLVLQAGESLQLPINYPELQGFGWGAALGAVGVLVFTIVLNWRQSTTLSRGDKDKTRELINKSGSGGLIAKNTEERKLAGWLSFAAGITEELFFRLILPSALVLVFGVEWVIPILVASVLLFGVAHAYQGLSGVVATSIVGAVFMLIFVSTGSILLIILIHILMDVRATVALSWMAYGRQDCIDFAFSFIQDTCRSLLEYYVSRGQRAV